MTAGLTNRARTLVGQWKGDAYAFGLRCVGRVGPMAAEFGSAAVLVANESPWLASTLDAVVHALGRAGVDVVARTAGARPNAPLDDLYRITDALADAGPAVVIAVGGGSTIDAAKAAAVLAALGGDVHDVEPYFGMGRVSAALAQSGRVLPPLLAVQSASGSAAHLTKYANITDPATAQKRLIVDDAIVPTRGVFDYATTRTAPRELTIDGALDGLAHLAEVYYGTGGEPIGQVEDVARTGVDLILSAVGCAAERGDDLKSREQLGLGTDLGGLAIMLGGTSGAHLTSFSLVDILTHGRACALMNPYYTVLFAPAIERQLRVLGEIYVRHGLCDADLDRLSGRELGVAVAEGMLSLSRRVGMPTTLAEVCGFSDAHVARALTAAKQPQLAMKLRNMPMPLATDRVDEIMGGVLEAARSGDLSRVPVME